MKRQILIPTLIFSFGLNALANTMPAADVASIAVEPEDSQEYIIEIPMKDSDQLVNNQELVELGKPHGITFKMKRMKCLDEVVSVVYGMRGTGDQLENEFVGICPEKNMSEPASCLQNNSSLQQRCNAGVRKMFNIETSREKNLITRLIEANSQAQLVVEQAAPINTCSDIKTTDMNGIYYFEYTWKSGLQAYKTDVNANVLTAEEKLEHIKIASNTVSELLTRYQNLTPAENTTEVQNQLSIAEQLKKRVAEAQTTDDDTIKAMYMNALALGNALSINFRRCQQEIFEVDKIFREQQKAVQPTEDTSSQGDDPVEMGDGTMDPAMVGQ